MLENRLVSAIIIFLIIFCFVHWLKPPLIYNDHGGFRQFGIGYKQKTVIPIWVVYKYVKQIRKMFGIKDESETNTKT